MISHGRGPIALSYRRRRRSYKVYVWLQVSITQPCSNVYFMIEVYPSISFAYVEESKQDSTLAWSSDICTTLSYNFHNNFGFLSFDWSKIIEREKKQERE
jgi:hypothetical protein